ncbi:MAG: response regulator transcription factor [Magnetococcales bacterium]|nr:response regulator transcription factor [Magnetococcales bacterium]
MRVLLAEPDTLLAQSVATGLEQAGFAVDWVRDGESGSHLAENCPYDFALLDGRLALAFDGVQWRECDMAATAISAMAGRDHSMILAMAGRAEGVPKPFSFDSLLTRVRTLLQRRPREPVPLPIEHGGLVVDLGGHRVIRSGQPVSLSPKEFALLAHLFQHPGRVISRTELIEHLYDESFDHDSNLIETFVSRIRKKLGAGVIETVRGVGYRLVVRKVLPNRIK